ncbi:MAG: DcaP family trimeric outer membrane transporter [Pseudomonadota bacterium]
MPQDFRHTNRLIAGAIGAVILAAPLASAFAADVPDIKLTWGGYIKIDVLASRFSDAAVAQGSGRDFYVPNAVPVALPGAESGHTYLDSHAKETRLFFKADSVIQDHKIGAYVEMDFLVNPGAGNETVTNAYNPGLRRAYITFDNLLVGQDWSTFQNLGALPEGLDFIGPTEGTTFVRQPMIRYTWNNLQVALENPETTVAANAGATFANTDDNSIPDLVLRYNLKTSSAGDYAFAVLARQLADRGTVGGARATSTGFGGTLSGKIPVFGTDDVRFMVSGGSGIGRYLAINTVGDAVLDGAGDLQRLKVVNAFVAYHHAWNEQWRSNFTVSALKASSNANLGGAATERAQSASVNLLYSPVPKLTFGTEMRYAKRTTMADNDGTLSRLQFSAKYAF